MEFLSEVNAGKHVLKMTQVILNYTKKALLQLSHL